MEDWKYRLRQAREKKYPKKTDFAKLVGVSNATVTDWEKSFLDGGIKELSATSLVKIHEVLEVDLCWLLTGRGAESAPAGPRDRISMAPTEIMTPPSGAIDEILKQATEMLETYRLANPAERRRIDRAFLEARSRIAADKAKLGAP